ncbi:AAA+-type ATPase [Coemansia sp. Benny D115]|nr:AAA+-type ATPase [Coemansia sp. Benny D115]
MLSIDMMQTHGISSGDLIRLSTPSSHVYATAWPTFLGEPEQIRLSTVMLLNCNAQLGDQIHVSQANDALIPMASRVDVSIATEFPLPGFAEACAKETLVDLGVVRLGQLADISVNGIPRRLRITGIVLESGESLKDATKIDGARVTRDGTLVQVVTAGKGTGLTKSLGSQHTASSLEIGGLDTELSEIQRLVSGALCSPESFASYGLHPPRGVLLCGPPGTGKTLLARRVARESSATVFVINGAEVTTRYVGEAEAKLRQVFMQAKAQSPSVVFIDEIDALCPKRSAQGGEVASRLVATLLALLDGIEDRGRVVLLAATNRPDALDPALRRPGRLDREIEVPVPTPHARLQILKAKLSATPHGLSDEMLEDIAGRTHGYVGADLEALVREAALLSIRQHKGDAESVQGLQIDKPHIEAALALVRPSCMREAALEIPSVRWEDIGGQEMTKQLLRESVEWPLRHPEAFTRLGIRPPKGVLLYGPPGCSKTLTAKALATEAGLNFLAVRGPELFSKWVGESEKAVRAVFRKARAAAPAIVFFDEIDALTVRRGTGDSTSVADRVLAQLLTELDGIEPLVNVTVVAATNRPDVIDPGLLRPDRIDRLIYVGPPDHRTRLEILRLQARKTPCAADVDLDVLATRSDGFSGAEVVSLFQDAAVAALTESPDAECVSMRHFDSCLAGFKKRITREMLQFYDDFRKKT